MFYVLRDLIGFILAMANVITAHSLCVSPQWQMSRNEERERKDYKNKSLLVAATCLSSVHIMLHLFVRFLLVSSLACLLACWRTVAKETTNDKYGWLPLTLCVCDHRWDLPITHTYHIIPLPYFLTLFFSFFFLTLNRIDYVWMAHWHSHTHTHAIHSSKRERLRMIGAHASSSLLPHFIIVIIFTSSFVVRIDCGDDPFDE